MNSEKIKDLIESAIEDFTNDEALSKILMKVQVIAHYLKNSMFSTWLSNEINAGYETKDSLREYRISNCEVFCNISSMAGMYQNIKVSTELFSNEKAKEVARIVLFYETILEIEGFSNSQKSLKKFLPNTLLFYINETLTPGWNTIDAWQVISNFTCKSIVENFKSKLLQFFLELSEQLEINVNFNVMANKKRIDKIVCDTIYAGIVSTGSNSSIGIYKSHIVGGSSNQVSLNVDIKNEIEKVIRNIEGSLKIFGNSQDEVKSEIDRIKIQIAKEKPKLSILKNSFEMLKSIFVEVVATGTAPLILEGINNITKLLV